MSKGGLHPVYAIIGADRFLRGCALAEIVRLASRDLDELGPARVNGGEADIAAVLDEVRTPSLLGGRRMVIVDDADDFVSEHRPTLEKYCSAASPDGCLVLLCDSMPRNTRLHKIIAEHGQVIPCEPMKWRELQTWIVRRAADGYGKRMSDATARLLRDLVGDSPGWLDTELGKLAAFVGSRAEITAQDVEAATGASREERIFAVVDAMAEGNAGEALRSLQQVWATDRAAPHRAIGGLAFSVRRLLEARREWEGGADLNGLARRVFTDPATLRRRFDYMTEARLEELQRGLLEIDLAVKTGASTVEVGIEKLIVKCAAAHSSVRAKAG